MQGHRVRGGCVALALTLALAVGAPVVLPAAPAEAQALDRNAEARVFFEKGNRLFAQAMRKRGRRKRQLLEQALQAYVSSLRIVRSRNALFNAAVVLEELDRHGEAFSYLTEYLQIPGLSDKERQEAQKRRDALRDEIAVLSVQSEPEGAEVHVDRLDLAARGRTPLQVAVEPGEHIVFLTLEGYERGKREVTATRGETVEASVALTPEPVPLLVESPFQGRLTLDGEAIALGSTTEVRPGEHTLRLERPGQPPIERRVQIEPDAELTEITLDATSGPGRLVVIAGVAAAVHVDGALVGQGEEVSTELEPGQHTVRVEAEGREPWEGSVRIAAGRATRLRTDLAPPGGGGKKLGRWPLWTGLAAAGLGATALGLSVRALQLNKDYDDYAEDNCPMGRCTDPAKAEAKLQDVEDANMLADVFWGISAAAGVTAIALWIANDDVGAESRATIAVTPTPQGGFVQAELPIGGM